MFTGIVDALGRIDAVHVNNGVELRVKASYKGVKKGESIAVNGACLTVEKVLKGAFTVHAVQTTLSRTLIGEWKKGRSVNLERALRAGDRFGGHFVQGHVDCVSPVVAFQQSGADFRLEVELPASFAHYLAAKGSIAVDGISLTVADVLPKSFVAWIVPYTKEHTNLDRIQAGDLVNLEFDILAKYVERMLPRSTQQK